LVHGDSETAAAKEGTDRANGVKFLQGLNLREKLDGKTASQIDRKSSEEMRSRTSDASVCKSRVIRSTLTTVISILFCGVIVFSVSGCKSSGDLPKKDSKEYAQVVSAFYVGLGALQVGDDVHAESELSKVTTLVPGEPAGWANWGVLALRQRKLDVAGQRFEQARKLAPDNDQIYQLLGMLESSRGNSANAIADWRKAVEINPKNYRAAYQLAEEVERQGGANSDAEYAGLIQKILAAQPDNLAAQLELCRIAAKSGDAATAKAQLAKISARSSAWPSEVKDQLKALQEAADGPNPKFAATRTTFLRNTLMRVPEFRESLGVLKAPPGEEAEPFTRFLKMEQPDFTPAAADSALTFEVKPALTNDAGAWTWVGAVQLGSEGKPVVAVANGKEVKLATGASFPFPGGAGKVAPTPDGILQVDFNYDFKTDLVLAGASGVKFMRQDSPEKFTDVTAATKLPKNVLNAAYTGAWAVDIEADGDLDIVLGKKDGVPQVLRNNGDDTFLAIQPFAGISGVKAFAWADFDSDGNADAAIVDGADHLHIFHNQRQGQFREVTLPTTLSPVKAIGVADTDNDGVLDLVAVESNGTIAGVGFTEKNGWSVTSLAQVPNAAAILAGDVRLQIADVDNNGAMDLVLSPVKTASVQSGAPLIWLGDASGRFTLLDHPAGLTSAFDVADLSGDGRLDLLGFDANGKPAQGVNRGTKNYHWQVVRPHAKQAVGDQRINPFGIGGEIEIRSGLLVQKQPISGPQLHFGLGNQTSAEVVRVVWPNGTVRAEFGVQADQEVVTEQRLKASCPFLFAWDGTKMEFLKDAVPWGSAIGLRINTIGTAKIATTGEWYKIGREQLKPHDGYYDLRITAELWEVYYYDKIALMTVDHPAGTEIFVDERFAIPPPKPGFTTVSTPHEIARAIDDNGTDVTEILRTLDGKALDTFGRGQFQGMTRDHYVEIDLGDEAPKSGPLYLIAQGSIHDTESSLNVAITQGNRWHAQGMSVEVPDEHGGWVTAQSNLGFPAGRKKTVLFNLTNIFRPGTPRKVRLRTNLEIYWDCIRWAVGAPNAEVKAQLLDASYADLHYRGYSVIEHPVGAGAPEVPHYNEMMGSKSQWRDMVGYYTRYGDVRELLKDIDDRYVIVNSGDEMSMRFTEQPAPPAGWVRDFVLVGDGWIKDGDFNSTFSRTVQPLPYHAKDLYVTPPGRLEDEYVYKKHPEDWQNYHTRYITPDAFQNSLRRMPRP
jgi:Tfp pilus assembly protein PilF